MGKTGVALQQQQTQHSSKISHLEVQKFKTAHRTFPSWNKKVLLTNIEVPNLNGIRTTN